ncbi:hypothetical protein Glove_319g49 [Diversispora epigaea]|uniref:Uncharacterized protein n=1 Tax=Diversispora epigaea TaxID=1348612 RepID=A0A397HPV5_9GLOM|nr:hypothetical protein Glove_319g49 [Diversispora epigaea]
MHTRQNIYIKKEWKSLPLTSSDCIALKGVKSREKISVEELLIETFLEPKKHQIEILEKACDRRQKNIYLTYARLGLKAEDQIPSFFLIFF